MRIELIYFEKIFNNDDRRNCINEFVSQVSQIDVYCSSSWVDMLELSEKQL